MFNILATKLHIPKTRPNLVPRPRLTQRLLAGMDRKLTLVSAPAGSGKTTLLAEWIPQSERCVTWLSLDEGDHDPVRFWTYFIAALQRLDAEIGKQALAQLQEPALPPIETILTTLLNEIAAFPDSFALVLDDYHAIDAIDAAIDAKPVDASKSIDSALAFLLEHLPPQMHLVITTREDPALPLARLRARDQLTELRLADLRFTPGEAADFLNHVMGLDLSAEQVDALEARTEGWIAGLQLAALSMQGREDLQGFIRAFSGDDRYIVEYLVAEVLQRQPEALRSFLLQTAILERLCGPLCEAVTGQAGGGERLQALERGNFFVVPLDDQRYWYRYHHLFAEVLSVHLKAKEPEQVSALHRRASEWYAQNGQPAEAVRHALAAGDFERAADQIEGALQAMRRSKQVTLLLGWLGALPGAVLARRPVLSGHFAGVLMETGDLEGAAARLRDAERWLGERPGSSPAEGPERSPAEGDSPAEMVVVDEDEFRRLPAWIAIYRAALALAHGEVASSEQYARRARELALAEDPLGLGAAAGFLGLAAWRRGDLEAAHSHYAECMAMMQRAGHLSDVIGSAFTLADLRIAQGRLSEARRIYERALQLALEEGAPAPRGAADLYVGLGELDRERNDLEAAAQHLLRSQELGEHLGLIQNRHRWPVAMARLREAQGDPEGALDLLGEAERRFVSSYFPDVRPVGALKARVWVAQGRLGEATGWAREGGLSAEDELSYLREFEHLTLARVLLAQARRDRTGGEMQAATVFLERLLVAAEEGGRTGSVIEILVLQALAHQAQGDLPAALAPLGRALALAEPEGYVRLFVDEGPPAAELLRAAVAAGTLERPGLAAYAGRLLAAFEAESQEETGEAPLPTASPAPPRPGPAAQPAENGLVEPLSLRELDVLRLFETELSGPEIARELRIALSTVRTHTKSIYGKLNVNNRRAAVKRAAELDLI